LQAREKKKTCGGKKKKKGREGKKGKVLEFGLRRPRTFSSEGEKKNGKKRKEGGRRKGPSRITGLAVSLGSW